MPENRKSIIESLKKDDLILKNENGKYSITNLGAILFAKKLDEFNSLKRKAIRVIQYKDNSKIETIKEIIKELSGNKGYTVGFEGLINYINNTLPSNEIIKDALNENKISIYDESVGTRARTYVPRWSK